MTAAQQRKVQGVVHLAAAFGLIAYLYAPIELHLQDAVRLIVLPVLLVTGVAMWHAPRIRRLRLALRRTRALDLAPSESQAELRGEVKSR